MLSIVEAHHTRKNGNVIKMDSGLKAQQELAKIEEQITRLQALGARPLGEPVTELLESAGVWWQVMADPEGNEFCILPPLPPELARTFPA